MEAVRTTTCRKYWYATKPVLEGRWVLEREVVLTFVCGFERVVQWLGIVGEMGPE